MRAELPNLNHCAVPFLSRAAVSLSWYDIISQYTYYKHVHYTIYKYIANNLQNSHVELCFTRCAIQLYTYLKYPVKVYFSQKRLPRKMKSRLVIVKCAGCILCYGLMAIRSTVVPAQVGGGAA